MKNVEAYVNIVSMLRDINLKRNSEETIREVLNTIASELEEYAAVVEKGLSKNEEK